MMQQDANRLEIARSGTGRFLDSALETRFVTGERQARVVHMRLFAGFLAAMLIGYALVNLLYF